MGRGTGLWCCSRENGIGYELNFKESKKSPLFNLEREREKSIYGREQMKALKVGGEAKPILMLHRGC